MSLAGLGALAGGIAGGYNTGEDRKERRATADALIAAQERQAASSLGAIPSGAPTAAATDYSGGRGVIRPAGTDGGNVGGAFSGHFGSLLDKHEGAGDYSTLFGHSQRDGGRFAGVDVTSMTLGDLKKFTDTSGEYGQWVKQRLGESGQRARVATPMGRYQIVGTTLRRTAKALGLGDDVRFDAATQDRMATYLARQRLASAKTTAGKRKALRNEWEGLQSVPDADLDRAIAQLEAG